MRVRGEVIRVAEEVITPFALEHMGMAMMTDYQRGVFAKSLSIDFAFFAESGVRYRANVFRQRGTVAMAIRRLDNVFRSFDYLMLPPALAQLSEFICGLVLVTGPTGSGKSTTLATLLHEINMTRSCHIITIEDPLEFIHENKKALVRQRRTIFRRAVVCGGLTSGPPRRSGRAARGRDARHRDDPGRHDRGGNRAPGVFHAAHE